MARFRAGLVAVAAGTLAVAVGWWSASDPAAHAATVISTVDGDTIVVEYRDGRRETVRILGIDTPETKHPTDGVECFGPEAAAHTRRRLLGRAVRVGLDVETVDRYGRRLAHIEIDGRSFADELLELGLARLLVIEPNDRGARRLLAIELEARAARIGLWGACSE